jgi:hypothetical protein
VRLIGLNNWLEASGNYIVFLAGLSSFPKKNKEMGGFFTLKAKSQGQRGGLYIP